MASSSQAKQNPSYFLKILSERKRNANEIVRKKFEAEYEAAEKKHQDDYEELVESFIKKKSKEQLAAYAVGLNMNYRYNSSRVDAYSILTDAENSTLAKFRDTRCYNFFWNKKTKEYVEKIENLELLIAIEAMNGFENIQLIKELVEEL